LSARRSNVESLCLSTEKEVVLNLLCRRALVRRQGELAQMVERSLSMREVAGSMPAFSSGLGCVRGPDLVLNLLCRRALVRRQGELAQMVERSLSMREVAGSMPAFSSGLGCVRV